MVWLSLRQVQLSLDQGLFGKVRGVAGFVLVRQVFDVELLEGWKANLMAVVYEVVSQWLQKEEAILTLQNLNDCKPWSKAKYCNPAVYNPDPKNLVHALVNLGPLQQ